MLPCLPFPYLKVLLIAWMIHKIGKFSYTFRAAILWNTLKVAYLNQEC